MTCTNSNYPAHRSASLGLYCYSPVPSLYSVLTGPVLLVSWDGDQTLREMYLAVVRPLQCFDCAQALSQWPAAV